MSRAPKFNYGDRINPPGGGGKRNVDQGLKHHLLAFAKLNTEQGFTEREAARGTAIFDAGRIVLLLERAGNRFTRVNEMQGNRTVTRYYLEPRK